MPAGTHAAITPISPHQPEIGQTNVACPAPLTPPPENNGNHDLGRAFIPPRPVRADEISPQSVSDNTAAGMSLMQEESLYTASESFEEKMHTDVGDGPVAVANDDNDAPMDESFKIGGEPRTEQHDDSPMSDVTESQDTLQTTASQKLTAQEGLLVADESTSDILSPPWEPPAEAPVTGSCGTGDKHGIPSVDQELDWASDLKEWDFSHRRLRPQYPSATFQPYSKFTGTQQSDRQIYNVEVTILTVDIEQCSMSGYLQICGLTPDHPTLTTFFTGEIIGGPDQKHSFRTREPAWGASDKTDLTHWARFPAWRPLSLHAKRNINFVYPMNHEHWWQQEYIFMRWKEHFLVPDYKLKSIQGASFEGFYYICFNQIEGRVSGIYFHSKSEK